jgi:hypothetical protein
MVMSIPNGIGSADIQLHAPGEIVLEHPERAFEDVLRFVLEDVIEACRGLGGFGSGKLADSLGKLGDFAKSVGRVKARRVGAPSKPSCLTS